MAWHTTQTKSTEMGAAKVVNFYLMKHPHPWETKPSGKIIHDPSSGPHDTALSFESDTLGAQGVGTDRRNTDTNIMRHQNAKRG